MKRLVFIFLLGLQTLTGWTNNHTLSIADSLLSILPTLPHDTTRLQVLEQLVVTTQGSSPRSFEFARQLFKEAQLQDNKYYLCNSAYYHILYYYNNDGKQDSIVKWMEYMKPIAQSTQYWKVYFNSLKLLINTYIYSRQYEYAFTEAYQMLEKAKETKSVNGKVAAYQCLANIYHETNRWKDEEKMLKEAYELLPQIAHTGAQVNILNQLVTFNKQVNNYTDLEKYLDKTKEVLNEIVRTSPEREKGLYDQYLYLEIYYTYLYWGLNNADLAKEHYEKCQLYITPDTFLPYLATYQNMAMEYHLHIKDYKTALALADSAISFVRKYEFGESDYAKEMGYKADILKEMKRYTDALPLYERITQIEDSISTAVSNQQLEEIKESYHLNQLVLEQGKLQGYIQIIILVIVGIVLILCITYMLRINRIRKELKLSEKETKEATLKMEEANEAKSRFLSNMSHAIRVPLNSVVGFSQLMAADMEISEKSRQEYSGIIQHNTEKLMLLVNNVLDLSRLEADMMKYQITDYDIVQLCNDAVGAAQMQKPYLHIYFQSSVKQYMIHTDCNRLIQTIISILTGPSTLPQEERDIYFSLERNGEILSFKVTNTALANKKYAGQETSIRHDINRLLLRHFGGTYQVITDPPAGPSILFTYPAVKVQ